jgi:hypothetical protein
VVDNDVRGVNVQDSKLGGEAANKMAGSVHSVGVLNRELEAVASKTEGAERNMDTLSMAFDACRATSLAGGLFVADYRKWDEEPVACKNPSHLK